MNVPHLDDCADFPNSLEAVEFEFALGAREILEFGFENCVNLAAAEAGVTVLFQMPADFLDDCQRAAAIRCGRGADERIVLVLLGKDGHSVRIADSGAENPVYRLACSYARLVRLAGSA